MPVDLTAALEAAALTASTEANSTVPAPAEAQSNVNVKSALEQVSALLAKAPERIRQLLPNADLDKVKSALESARAKLPSSEDLATMTEKIKAIELPDFQATAASVKAKAISARNSLPSLADLKPDLTPATTLFQTTAVAPTTPDADKFPLTMALHALLERQISLASEIPATPSRVSSVKLAGRNATTHTLAYLEPKIGWSESLLSPAEPVFAFLQKKGVKKEWAKGVALVVAISAVSYAARKTWRARPRHTLDALSLLPASYLVLRQILPDRASDARSERAWLVYYLVLSAMRLGDYKGSDTMTVLDGDMEKVLPSWWMFAKLVTVIWMMRGGKEVLYNRVLAIHAKLTGPPTAPVPYNPHVPTPVLPSAPSFSMAPIALPNDDIPRSFGLEMEAPDTPMRKPGATYVDRRPSPDHIVPGQMRNVKGRY